MQFNCIYQSYVNTTMNDPDSVELPVSTEYVRNNMLMYGLLDKTGTNFILPPNADVINDNSISSVSTNSSVGTINQTDETDQIEKK